MGLLATIKPFWPIILTFILPRALSYYRSIRVAAATKGPPCPLPPKISSSLNVFFASICLFLVFSSFPFIYIGGAYQPNVFEQTDSRFHMPTDSLFQKLAILRPLTAVDIALRDRITTPVTRQLYLRYGPNTLLNCPFCHPLSPETYLIHYLPLNLIFPHLLHLFLIGLATSSPISGLSMSTLSFRRSIAFSAIVLALIDAFLTTSVSRTADPRSPFPPSGIYWRALTWRPLSICLFDAVAAAVIYLTFTNRLPLLSPQDLAGQGDDISKKQSQLDGLLQNSVLVQNALMRLRALSVVRGAVVRDGKGLKARDDEYWRVVVAMEGPSPHGEAGPPSIWEDEEVMETIARVTREGEKGVDIEQVRNEAGAWIDGVTKGIE